MSIEYINRALAAKCENATQKAVLFVLANYADEKGFCFPGIERLTEEACASERTVYRSLDGLYAAKLVRKGPPVKTKNGDGNSYFLTLSRVKTEPVKLAPSENRTCQNDSQNLSNWQSEPVNMTGEPPSNHQGTTIAHAQSQIAQNGFDDFWRAYPKKKDKAKARKSFEKALKKTSLENLIKALEAQKKSHDWQKDGGQFIPYPTTWLNGERWEDELEQSQADQGEEERRQKFQAFCRENWKPTWFELAPEYGWSYSADDWQDVPENDKKTIRESLTKKYDDHQRQTA